MNKGGFSWKKLSGYSAVKSKLSRKIGIPLTKSGRNQKVGKIITEGCLGIFIALSLPVIIILLIFMINFQTFGQSTDENINRKLLEFYYSNDGCPYCNDKHPEIEFGFKIICVGCSLTPEMEKQNKKTIKELDKKKGNGWTENYIKNYCT